MKFKLSGTPICWRLVVAATVYTTAICAQIPTHSAISKAKWQTEYEPVTVELRKEEGKLYRLSARGNLKVVTEFNANNTPHFVQDSQGQAKSYEYDGNGHVTAIHRGVMQDGLFVEDSSKLTLVAYNKAHSTAYILSYGRALSIGLGHLHASRSQSWDQQRYPWAHGLLKPVILPAPPPSGGDNPDYVDCFPYTYNVADIGNFSFQGYDYAIDATITYGPIETPIEQFGNDVIEYLSSPAGETALAAITISTLLASPEVAPLVFEAIEASGIFYETVATGAAVSVAELEATNAESLTTLDQQAILRGRSFESLALRAFDLVKNSTTYYGQISLNGVSTSVGVIPDAVTSDSFAEIKSVQELFNTIQIRAEAAAASSQGKQLDLIIDSTVMIQVSQTVIDSVASTGGTITL